MAKHTPGPWMHNGLNSTDPEFSCAVAVYGAKGQSFICSVSTPEHLRRRQVSDDAADANCRLIAAAPDMREALEAGACPHWVHNAAITNDIEDLRRIALWYADWSNGVRLAALAKAEGR